MALFRLYLMRGALWTASHAAASSCPPGNYDTHHFGLPVSMSWVQIVSVFFGLSFHPLHICWHLQGPVPLAFCTLVIPLSVSLATSKFFLRVKFFHGLLRPLSSETSDLNDLSYASSPLSLYSPILHFTECTVSFSLRLSHVSSTRSGNHFPNNIDSFFRTASLEKHSSTTLSRFISDCEYLLWTES